MPENYDQTRLLGTWWRVAEEDEPGLAVYRREGAPLPPARGRHGFTLHAGGRATLFGPGPTDRRESTESHWQIDAQGKLHVEGTSDAAATIAHISDDRLTLRR
jgi:hypothetical protein